MIDVSKVKTIIVHGGGCPDGIASAKILVDALPHAAVRFVSHNSPEHKGLEPEPGLLFCDFVPWGERDKDGALTEAGRAQIQRFVLAGTIVLDHHASARDVVTMFGPNGVFADEKEEPGVCGAVLAYREVWEQYAWSPRRNTIGNFATLAGIRDTWQKDHPRWDEACTHADALRFWPWDRIRHAAWADIEQMMSVGEVLREKNAERDRESIRQAYRFTANGVRVVVVSGLHTSDIMETLANEADLVVGFSYFCDAGQPKMGVSMRSRNGFSCLPLAKERGGGGHANAAGFTVNVEPTDRNPYEHVKTIIRGHLEAWE